jgi:hypothetical protein
MSPDALVCSHCPKLVYKVLVPVVQFCEAYKHTANGNGYDTVVVDIVQHGLASKQAQNPTEFQRVA